MNPVSVPEISNQSSASLPFQAEEGFAGLELKLCPHAPARIAMVQELVGAGGAERSIVLENSPRDWGKFVDGDDEQDSLRKLSGLQRRVLAQTSPDDPVRRLLVAWNQITEVRTASVTVENELFSSPDECLTFLRGKLRTVQSQRDDQQEELALIEEELRTTLAESLRQRLQEERSRRSQLLESLGHARECNRRRQDLTNRLEGLRRQAPSSCMTQEITAQLEEFHASLRECQDAQEQLEASEAIIPLTRPAGWTVPLDSDALHLAVRELPVLQTELEDLRLTAREIQQDSENIAGPALEQKHLEELAQQLVHEPELGLEALDAQKAPEPEEDPIVTEERLRGHLDGLMLQVSLALGVLVLGGAAGAVLLLGGTMVPGVGLLVLGPSVGGSWALRTLSQRKAFKRELSELIYRRVSQASVQGGKDKRNSVGGLDETDSGNSRLPEVADRVRLLLEARRATAVRRLQTRSNHASWTKKVLQLPNWLRDQLPAVPDAFDRVGTDRWIFQAGEVAGLCEVEVVRRERTKTLESMKKRKADAVTRVGAARAALTACFGPESESWTHAELSTHAAGLEGIKAEILAVESALQSVAAIPEAPLTERMQALDERIEQLETQIQSLQNGDPIPEELTIVQAAPVQQKLFEQSLLVEKTTEQCSRLRAMTDSLNRWLAHIDRAGQLVSEKLQRELDQRADCLRVSVNRVIQRFWNSLPADHKEQLEMPTLDTRLDFGLEPPPHLAQPLNALRILAILALSPRAHQLILPEPLPDVDQPTWSAFLAGLEDLREISGPSRILILSCQPWRKEALNALRQLRTTAPEQESRGL